MTKRNGADPTRILRSGRESTAHVAADGRSAGMVGWAGHLLVGDAGVGGGPQAAAGQHVKAEVAAAFGSLVVLLGEAGADHADHRVAVWEDAVHVGAGHLGLGALREGPQPLVLDPLRGALDRSRLAGQPGQGARVPSAAPLHQVRVQALAEQQRTPLSGLCGLVLGQEGRRTTGVSHASLTHRVAGR